MTPSDYVRLKVVSPKAAGSGTGHVNALRIDVCPHWKPAIRAGDPGAVAQWSRNDLMRGIIRSMD